MDRSYLSQADVVTASRSFVCIRLATYENKSENDFLKQMGGAGRSGDIENTVFAILPPEGKRALVGPARSARRFYKESRDFADDLQRVARQYPGRKGEPQLPLVANLRLGLNIAASDQRPLVILMNSDRATREKLEDKVRTLAWSERFIGRFVYVTLPSAKGLNAVTGADAESDLFVVQPDRFGLKGSVLERAAASANSERLAAVLKAGMDRYRPEAGTFNDHVREGHRQGLFWDTVLPVTDPMEARARSRK